MLFVHDTPSTVCPLRCLGASWRSPLERTRAGARHPQPQPLGPTARHLHAAPTLMPTGYADPALQPISARQSATHPEQLLKNVERDWDSSLPASRNTQTKPAASSDIRSGIRRSVYFELGAYGERLSKGGAVVPNHAGSHGVPPSCSRGVLLTTLWQHSV